MNLSLSVPLLFHKVLGIFYSVSIQILLMSVNTEIHIFLMLPVSVCSGNSLCLERIVVPSLILVGALLAHSLHGSGCALYLEISFSKKGTLMHLK